MGCCFEKKMQVQFMMQIADEYNISGGGAIAFSFLSDI